MPFRPGSRPESVRLALVCNRYIGPLDSIVGYRVHYAGRTCESCVRHLEVPYRRTFSRRNIYIFSMATEYKRGSEVQDDPRWLLVHRAVKSDTFARTPRLAEFLTFVSERTLTGRVNSTNEQEIAVKAFGRESGYLQSDDNIVRVNASRLRQRLDEYFSSEGTGETLRISLPKGRYIPEFVTVPIPQITEDASPTDTLAVEDTNRDARRANDHRATILGAISLLLLCIVGVLLFALHARSDRTQPAGKQSATGDRFWTPFLLDIPQH